METSTKILFSNDDGYQFETDLDEDKTAMQVHVSRNNITLFQSTMSIATPTSRNSKFLFSGETSTIYNDTDEALYCSLSDAGSYADAKTMALGGLGVFYAFLGLAAAIPGMPPPSGVSDRGARHDIGHRGIGGRRDTQCGRDRTLIAFTRPSNFPDIGTRDGPTRQKKRRHSYPDINKRRETILKRRKHIIGKNCKIYSERRRGKTLDNSEIYR